MKDSIKSLLNNKFKDYMAEHYTNGTASVPDIAKEFDTYPNMIYRAMRKLGIERRSRSDAQKVVLETGKSNHPTKGTELGVETKRKIGQAVFESNLNISDEERKRRIDKKKEIWSNIPEETRAEYLKKSHQSLQRSAKKGSKFEEFIVAGLLSAKYQVQVHHKVELADTSMNVDIYLPFHGVAIEIDGPCHFEPIFGEESLKIQLERDAKKNALLIGDGYSLIRVKNPRGYVSVSFMKTFMDKFLPYLEEVIEQEENGLFQIEVNDKEFNI